MTKPVQVSYCRVKSQYRRCEASIQYIWFVHFTGDDTVEDDEALARRLQEQEDALATRGRATRGALRVKQKPGQPADKAPSREARHARRLGSAAVRSSSRLRPETAPGKQRPVTRGSSGRLMLRTPVIIRKAVAGQALCGNPVRTH